MAASLSASRALDNFRVPSIGFQFTNALSNARPALQIAMRMMNGYDLLYGTLLGLSSPYWLIKPSARRKVRDALRQRMGHDAVRPDPFATAVMIHAVSVGELNAAAGLIQQLSDKRPALRFVISVTTATGWDRAQQLYGQSEHITLIRYPLDFTAAVRRTLDGIRPSIIVLMELEVWPNFLRECKERGIPVIVANGRVTPGSLRNYQRGGAITWKMFQRLSHVCAQDEAYAAGFALLGVPRDRLSVTGTMKFDTANISAPPAAGQLAADLGLHPGQEPIWVCGSTGPGEEAIVIALYRELLNDHPTLRLVLVPRKPERFEDVADLVEQAGFRLVRRSGRPGIDIGVGNAPPVVLGDTMGELRAMYALADVVFVGRSLIDLGERQNGSDMIEPAALAKPVVVGPHTANFADAMRHFRAAKAIAEAKTPDELRDVIARWLAAPAAAAEAGHRARAVVSTQQGATGRHVEMILGLLDQRPQSV